MNFAPILIPTLNRYEHLKRCVESLAANTFADKTELVIGLDYPPAEKYFEGYKKVKEYLPTIKGFQNVTVLTTEVNLNPIGNFCRLVDYVKEKGYDSYITTEDDNEFSPNFLSYCNWALDYFRDDKSIFYICGYNLIETPYLINNIYKYNHAFCAWGCATWLDRRERELEVYDFNYMKRLVDSYPLSILFDKKKLSLASSLLYMIKKQYILGDTAIQAIPEEYRWCIFPKVSLVRNWGHDGSGIHGGTKDSYERLINSTIDNASTFTPNIVEDLFSPDIKHAYQNKYGHKSVVSIFRSSLRFLWYKTTGCIVVLERPKGLKRRKK